MRAVRHRLGADALRGMIKEPIRSTDHISFDAVGLPAFQFIQDPLKYGSRTYHSNMDLYDLCRPSIWSRSQQ
jgi:hypothetical protein